MKKNLFKMIAIFLCFAMAAGLAACGDGDDSDDDGSETKRRRSEQSSFSLNPFGKKDEPKEDVNTSVPDFPTVPEQPDDDTIVPAAPAEPAAEGLDKIGEYTRYNTAYVIGATGPLSGEAEYYGKAVLHGAQIAVNEINAAGGLNGVPFELRMLDDEADADLAKSAYNTLYEGGMQVSIGSVTSRACEAFAAHADEDRLFLITPSASAASVIAASKYAFRVCFGDLDQGVIAADELTGWYTKIGVIYDTSDTYSCDVFEAFKTRMAELGKDFIEQNFDAENNRDFSTQVDALRDCEAIFLPIYCTEASLIAKACAAKGVNAVLFGCDGFDGIADLIDGSVTNRIKYITPFDPEAADEKTRNFVKVYKEAYNAVPDQFAADGYDAVYVVYSVMLKTGVDNVKVDPAELGSALVAAITSPDFSYTGVTGRMRWRTDGTCVKDPIYVTLN